MLLIAHAYRFNTVALFSCQLLLLYCFTGLNFCPPESYSQWCKKKKLLRAFA